MTRLLTTLSLLVGCWHDLAWLFLLSAFQLFSLSAFCESPRAKSSVTLAAPILTIQAPAHVVIQDSTNLVDWQDVAETQDLTLLPAGVGFLRGRVTQTSVTIAFDRNPAAAGTFIYLGAKSHDYFQRFDAGTNALLALTIILPTPDLYFTGTSYLADGTESDFAVQEVHIQTPQPVLTVTVVKQ